MTMLSNSRAGAGRVDLSTQFSPPSCAMPPRRAAAAAAVRRRRRRRARGRRQAFTASTASRRRGRHSAAAASTRRRALYREMNCAGVTCELMRSFTAPWEAYRRLRRARAARPRRGAHLEPRVPPFDAVVADHRQRPPPVPSSHGTSSGKELTRPASGAASAMEVARTPQMEAAPSGGAAPGAAHPRARARRPVVAPQPLRLGGVVLSTLFLRRRRPRVSRAAALASPLPGVYFSLEARGHRRLRPEIMRSSRSPSGYRLHPAPPQARAFSARAHLPGDGGAADGGGRWRRRRRRRRGGAERRVPPPRPPLPRAARLRLAHFSGVAVFTKSRFEAGAAALSLFFDPRHPRRLPTACLRPAFEADGGEGAEGGEGGCQRASRSPRRRRRSVRARTRTPRARGPSPRSPPRSGSPSCPAPWGTATRRRASLGHAPLGDGRVRRRIFAVPIDADDADYDRLYHGDGARAHPRRLLQSVRKYLARGRTIGRSS